MPDFYADSSALVKLVHEERESNALRSFVAEANIVSSELVLTEVRRAANRVAADDSSVGPGSLLDRAEYLLGSIGLRPLDADILVTAGAIPEPTLRSLDAIHVVTAVDLSPLSGFISYDKRQAAAARAAGLRTIAPGT